MSIITDDIKNNTIAQVYLLYGEEQYLLQDHRAKLLENLIDRDDTMNFSRFQGKDIDIPEVISLCETMPFFAERRVLLFENTGFFKNACDELADYLTELPDYLYLVFSEEQVDKRTRMYKAVSKLGRVAEFKYLDEKMLLNWVAGILKKNGRTIDRSTAELFLSMEGTEMQTLRMELEKLIGYTEGRSRVTREDVEAVCTVRTENRIFDMIRAVSERDQKKALALYDDLLTLREPPMKILFLLGRQYNQLLMIREMQRAGLSFREINGKLKLPAFAMRTMTACVETYSIGQLKEAVRDMVDAEEAVKTGRLSDVMSVELMIVKYSSLTKQKAAT